MLNKYKFIKIIEGDFCKIIEYKICGLMEWMSSHNIGCISYVNIHKWQIYKEGSKLLLTFNIVNIPISNMRGARFC